jgi:hypothetical protein
MSLMGQKADKPPRAKIYRCPLLHTNSGQILQRSEMTQCAKSRLLHRSKLHRYSITSSARQISVLGTLRPSALAAELPDPSSSAPRA